MRIGSIFGLIAVLALVGCSEKDGAGGPASADAAYTIAVIPKGTAHSFWKSVHAGAEDAAREMHVKVIWEGPLNEDDREEQIKIVESFIARGVDGIVLAPLDDIALRLVVEEAVNNGIPVVIFDSAIKDSDIVSFVATDNFEGGRMAGRHMAELLGGSGRVLVLRYQEGSDSTTQRERGFIEAATSGGLEIVSSEQFAGASIDSAQSASENLIARFSSSDSGLDVDGIFCPNESSTFGMLLALEDAGFAGTVKFIGFDSSKKLVDGLAAGNLDALVVQNPMRMGYIAVKTMVAHLDNIDTSDRIDTGAELVTRENMNDENIQDLINPQQK